MSKIVSFSIFGNNPIYSKGLERNLDLASTHYPDWKLRVYSDVQNYRDLEKQFRQSNIELIESDLRHPNHGLFERFRPMFDSSVELWISRDLDSRITSREAAAVYEWENSGEVLHVMRDSHNHSYPIMAGMFGMKKINRFSQIAIRNKIESYYGNQMHYDQLFLSEIVWKKYKGSCLIHDHWRNRLVENLPNDIDSEGGVSVAEAYGVGLEKFLNVTRDSRHRDIFPKKAIIRNFPKESEAREPLYVGQIVQPDETPAHSQAMRWEYELRGKEIPKEFNI